MPRSSLAILPWLALAGCSPQIVDAIVTANCGGGSAEAACAAGGAGAASNGGSGASGASAAGGALGASGASGTAGASGAGAAGAGTSGAVGTNLLHHYRFDGSGTLARDSVGGADGEIVNTSLNGTGELSLAGLETDEFVDLPNGIISSLQSATFEAWVTWRGGSAWQRIFDFGDTLRSPEGEQEVGRSYLFLTARSGINSLRAAYKLARDDTMEPAEILCDGPEYLSLDRLHQVAVTIDAELQRMSLFMDGVRLCNVDLTDPLSALNDVNNWLGRSQFEDPEFAGQLYDFRIYGVALSTQQIAQNHDSGPE